MISRQEIKVWKSDDLVPPMGLEVERLHEFFVSSCVVASFALKLEVSGESLYLRDG